MLQILRFWAPGKADLPGTLGRHRLDLAPTLPAGCCLKSTVPAFSSLSEISEPRPIVDPLRSAIFLEAIQ